MKTPHIFTKKFSVKWCLKFLSASLHVDLGLQYCTTIKEAIELCKCWSTVNTMIFSPETHSPDIISLSSLPCQHLQ